MDDDTPQWIKDSALLIHVAAFFDTYDREHGIEDDKSTQADLRRIAHNIVAANRGTRT